MENSLVVRQIKTSGRAKEKKVLHGYLIRHKLPRRIVFKEAISRP
jgi:hypothetical protein